jgi:hypothetical protein
MIINFLRALLIFIAIFVIVIDVELPIIINTPTNQLFIGILVIITMLAVDEIVGFLLGLIFLILYFKFYQKKINPSSKTSADPFSQYLLNPFVDALNHINTPVGADSKPQPYSLQPVIPEHFIQHSADNSVTTMPYISNELLKAAQTNIYDEKNYNLEIMQDGGNFYGIQGLNSDNKHYEAFDNKYTQYNSV